MFCFHRLYFVADVITLNDRHIEGNAELVVIRNAGHAVNLEKPKEFTKQLKAFLVDN